MTLLDIRLSSGPFWITVVRLRSPSPILRSPEHSGYDATQYKIIIYTFWITIWWPQITISAPQIDLRSSNGGSECLDNNLVLSSVIKLITGMLRSGNGDLRRTMVIQNGPDDNLVSSSVIILITWDVLVIWGAETVIWGAEMVIWELERIIHVENSVIMFPYSILGLI